MLNSVSISHGYAKQGWTNHNLFTSHQASECSKAYPANMLKYTLLDNWTSRGWIGLDPTAPTWVELNEKFGDMHFRLNPCALQHLIG